MTRADGLPWRSLSNARRTIRVRRESAFALAVQAAMLLLVGIAIGALHPSGSEAQSAAGSPAGAARDTFGVQPGDLVRLKVWREPDMSGDVVIDAAGDATLPNRRESREPESPVQSFAANADVSG